jgi:hypothetical protein
VYSGDDSIIKTTNADVQWTYRGAKHRGIGIVGCARSGTVYMTNVLRELGYKIGHEVMGEDGSVGYHLAVLKPNNCLHQVRHPIKQINSMFAHKAWGWCDRLIEVPDYGLLGCMQYWLMWNAMCEDFCVWRYQIEQLPEVWDEFLVRIGHNKCELPDLPTNTNTHRRKEDYVGFSWEDLIEKDKDLTVKIMKMAKRYGYDVPEMDKAEYQNLGELETAQVASV